MKLSIFVNITALLLSWHVSHAADKEGIAQRSIQKITQENPSEKNRIGKKFSITGQLTGPETDTPKFIGIAATYYLNRNSLIQAEVSRDSSNWKYDDIPMDKLSGTSVAMHYKRFLGNSFYIRGGLDYFTFRYTGNAYSSELVSFHGQTLDASLLVGNQWQWENFTLGCDWVGVGTRLVSTSSNEEIPTNPIFIEDGRKELQHAKDVRLKYQALRFYAGYSF